jgi:hypothetical protein
MTKPKPKDGNEITVEVAAGLLMLTTRQVQRLAKDGWIPKPYTVVGVVQGYILSRDDSDKRKTASAEKVKGAEIKNRREELAFAILEGNYVETDMALEVLDTVLGYVRTAMESVPAMATRDMPTRHKIEDLIRNGLTSAANKADEAAGALTESRDHIATLETNVARRVGAQQQNLPAQRGRPRSKKS